MVQTVRPSRTVQQSASKSLEKAAGIYTSLRRAGHPGQDADALWQRERFYPRASVLELIADQPVARAHLSLSFVGEHSAECL